MQTHINMQTHTHKHASTHTTSTQSAASASPSLGQHHHHHHHRTSTASSTRRRGHCSPPSQGAPWGCCHPCPASAGWRAGCPGCCSADRPACTAATCNNRTSTSSLSSALVVSNPQFKGGSEGNRFPPSLIGLLAYVDVKQQKLNRFPTSAHTVEHVTCHCLACTAEQPATTGHWHLCWSSASNPQFQEGSERNCFLHPHTQSNMLPVAVWLAQHQPVGVLYHQLVFFS